MAEADIALTPEQAQAVGKSSEVAIISPNLKTWKATTGEVFIVDEVLGKHECIAYAEEIYASGDVRPLGA